MTINTKTLAAITFSAQIFQELDTCKMKLVSTGGLYDEKTVLSTENLQKRL